MRASYVGNRAEELFGDNKTALRAGKTEHFRSAAFVAVGVLIVEDEFLLGAHAVEFMEHSGFTVYEASNADEAIELLELHDDIRAVFTDIHMPGTMDGLKLAHYVRGRWPPVTMRAAGRRHASRKRVRRQALSARKCGRQLAGDDRVDTVSPAESPRRERRRRVAGPRRQTVAGVVGMAKVVDGSRCVHLMSEKTRKSPPRLFAFRHS